MVPPKKINMTIVKMNNGGLILYAPVKLHHGKILFLDDDICI